MKGYDENTQVFLTQHYNFNTHRDNLNDFFRKSKDKIIINIDSNSTNIGGSLYHTTYVYYKLK